jgi:hypothetical protein
MQKLLHMYIKRFLNGIYAPDSIIVFLTATLHLNLNGICDIQFCNICFNRTQV